MARYILALDQGTSSSRAVVFDESGGPVAEASRSFPQIYPQPGWVEHDPEEIWRSQLDAARAALSAAGIEPRQVAAIGITNQRETTLVWERATGRPVHNAIVWQCRRTAGMCDDMRRRGLEPWVREKTGLVIDAYFSGTKLRWLLDNVDGVRQQAERGELAFGTADSWLAYRLTDGAAHVTDATNASRTMLYNIRERRWDPELLRELRIPEPLLPRVCASNAIVGTAVPSLLGAEVPIAGIAGDQQAALVGQCCFGAGAAKNTYGTGSFLLLNAGSTPPISRDLLTTIAFQVDSRIDYALEGSIFITGAAVQWLRDGLGIIESAAESEALAASVESSDGVYVVPAFVGLGAPHWDPYARGAVLGITRGTTRAHIARATLESIAFQTRDVVEAMERESGIALGELRVDGGAARNDLLMQLQADILGRRVVRAAVLETTALGAAFLAGLGTGVWKDLDDIARLWRADRAFEPRMPERRREEMYGRWKRALERAKGWAQE